MTTIIVHKPGREHPPRKEAMLTSSGKPAKDQFVHYYDDGSSAFVSYGTTIAVRPADYPKSRIQLDKHKWNYSITTARYRNRFLGEATAATRKRIQTGQYELVSLNV